MPTKDSQGDETHTSVAARDECLSFVVRGLGGAGSVARLLGCSRYIVYDWVKGKRRIPPSAAERLARESATVGTLLINSQHHLLKLAAAGRERRARTINAERERYYVRFGRYPVPARMDKPTKKAAATD